MIVPELTPREMRVIDVACAIRTGFFGGGFFGLVALVFIEHGRLLRLLIGG